jgi:hypothetical protein
MKRKLGLDCAAAGFALQFSHGLGQELGVKIEAHGGDVAVDLRLAPCAIVAVGSAIEVLAHVKNDSNHRVLSVCAYLKQVKAGAAGK